MPDRSVIFLVSHSSAGGAQEIWSNLADGFKQRGFDVALMALYPFGKTVRESPDDLPWQYIVQDRPNSVFAMVNMLRQFVVFLKKNRPHTIFTAMPAANVIAPLAVKLSGVPVRVITSHHSPAETHNRWINMLDSLTGSLSAVVKIIAVSNAVSRSLGDKPARYRDKRITIYNALPPEIEGVVAKLAVNRLRHMPHSGLVVATGRLAAQKNYPLLIRSVKYMPGVSVNIIGDGPDADELQDLARAEGVSDRIRFLGHMPRADALAQLAKGDVFVQVSLFEGHSLALIEAAKLGLPMVVSNVPVQIEGTTAKDGQPCAITVELGDEEGLARQIQRLLNEPEYYQHWASRAQILGAEATFNDMLQCYVGLVE